MDKKQLEKAISLARSHSPHLRDTLEREENLIESLSCEEPETVLQSLLTATQREHASQTDTNLLKSGLRRLKRQCSLIIALADLSGAWPLEQVTRSLSNLADACLGLALNHLLIKAHGKGQLAAKHPPDPENSGLLVVGVGKLGAHELNYSSDIDILILYEEGRVGLKNPEDTSAFCIRLARDMVAIMEEKTADGYVFRTDLRLRPDPGSMPLAVSFKAAEVYYGSFGQNWERAAMIKARPVTGDKRLARDFTALMNAWIWRRNLDFAAIQDIHSIKRQIDARNDKPRRGASPGNLSGFNVKLGHGGIREIEFFAQTQQLIYGGKTPSLRAPATLDSLDRLATAGQIAPETATEMKQAYTFLRTIEHRLQMTDDHQTHSLPDNDADMQTLALFSGFTTADALQRRLEIHLDCVRRNYAQLFKESPSLTGKGGSLVFTGTEDDPETIATLSRMGFASPSTVAAGVRGWHHGRVRATRSDRARQVLTELVPALLEQLGKTPHPDDAFVRFDRFLSQLPAGVPIFSMLLQNPDLLQLTTEIMGTAPSLAEHLGQHPAVLEGVFNRDFFLKLPDAAYLARDLEQTLAAAGNYEDILDRARIWARDRRFHGGIHILKSLSSAQSAGRYLADIAETALNALLPHVRAEFEAAHGTFPDAHFGLIAMGGLGGSDMTTSSDLDLVAVYDVPDKADASNGKKPLSPPHYYIRLTQRLLTALTAPTAEGRLYDVDMRLRPSGNDGPLAVSLDGFITYEAEKAWTWEHMCLLRARAVATPPKLADKIDGGIARILRRPRDAAKLDADIADMRRRIEAEHPSNDPWDVRYARGGLVDIAFIVQNLLLKNMERHPELYPARTAADALERLTDKGLLAAGTKKTLDDAYRLQRGVEQFLTLAAEKPFVPGQAPAALKEALAHSVTGQTDFDELEKRLITTQTQTRRIWEKRC